MRWYMSSCKPSAWHKIGASSVTGSSAPSYVSCTGSSRAPSRLIRNLVSCRRQLCHQMCDGCSLVTPHSSHLLFLPLPHLKHCWDAVFIFFLCLPISQNINCLHSDRDMHFLPKAITASTVKAAILMAVHCVGLSIWVWVLALLLTSW